MELTKTPKQNQYMITTYLLRLVPTRWQCHDDVRQWGSSNFFSRVCNNGLLPLLPSPRKWKCHNDVKHSEGFGYMMTTSFFLLISMRRKCHCNVRHNEVSDHSTKLLRGIQPSIANSSPPRARSQYSHQNKQSCYSTHMAHVGNRAPDSDSTSNDFSILSWKLKDD